MTESKFAHHKCKYHGKLEFFMCQRKNCIPPDNSSSDRCQILFLKEAGDLARGLVYISGIHYAAELFFGMFMKAKVFMKA